MSGRARTGAAVLALGLGLLGCGAEGPLPAAGGAVGHRASPSGPPVSLRPGTTPSASPTGPTTGAAPLVVTLRQYRRDVAARRLQVTARNAGRQPFTVASVRLLAPGFEAEPATPKDTLLRPGQRVDLPVPYGAARCGGPAAAAPPAEAPAAALTLRAPDGAVTEHVLRADDEGLLDRLRRRECDERRLRAAARVVLGPPWEAVQGEDGEPALRGVVRVERASPDVAVTLEEVAASVLFTVRADGPPRRPLVVLAADTPAAEQPVLFRTARCDGHALAESKKSYTFPAWARVAGGESVATTVTPDEAGRRGLDELVRRSCLQR